MPSTRTHALLLLTALSATGCAGMHSREGAIMQEAPGDPAGSASIGTGSVTTGSTIPSEAKSSGIGLAP